MIAEITGAQEGQKSLLRARFFFFLLKSQKLCFQVPVSLHTGTGGSHYPGVNPSDDR